MLVYELLREWGEQWDQPSEKLFADFKNIKSSLSPEKIVHIQAMLDRYETAIEHDNNELAADLYDHLRHFIDARLVANTATTDTNEQEEDQKDFGFEPDTNSLDDKDSYQHEVEGDDPNWIEDDAADQSLNSAGDEA